MKGEIKINKRNPFTGLKVTPENRRRYITNEQVMLIEKGLDPSLAFSIAKRTIDREKKHYQAWLKGKKSFRFGYITEKVHGKDKRVPNIIIIP